MFSAGPIGTAWWGRHSSAHPAPFPWGSALLAHTHPSHGIAGEEASRGPGALRAARQRVPASDDTAPALQPLFRQGPARRHHRLRHHRSARVTSQAQDAGRALAVSPISPHLASSRLISPHLAPSPLWSPLRSSDLAFSPALQLPLVLRLLYNLSSEPKPRTTICETDAPARCTSDTLSNTAPYRYTHTIIHRQTPLRP